MITSVVSTATRLSLAPARLAGRLAGSLLGELRGNGATANARRDHSSSRAKPARRTRAKAQPKPPASRTRAKAQPRRPAGRTRAKAQPKRVDSGTSTKAQPKRAPRRKPLDDVTIARKVESTIFRDAEVDKGDVDVNVADGVVWLRGEVQTRDLINELTARAARVTEVRRVESLLHLPETPAPTRTDTPAPQRETGNSPASPEDRAIGQGETSAEVPAPASDLHTSVRAAEGKPGGQPPVGSGGGAANAAGNESPEQEGRQAADHPTDPGPGNSAGSRRGSDHTASEHHTPPGG
jgi:BON domain